MHFIYFLLPLSVLARAHKRPIHGHHRPSITVTSDKPTFTPSVNSSLPSFPSHTPEPIMARQPWQNSSSALAVSAESYSSSYVPTVSFSVVTYTIGGPISSQLSATVTSSTVSASSSASKHASTMSTSKTKPTTSAKATTKVTTTAKATTSKTTTTAKAKATTTKAAGKPAAKHTTTKQAAKPTVKPKKGSQ
ncbi:hypothetical protein F5Y13DRAFT_185917 [Hypoxylon sp. FL1857]|nr:hypothetical protein F5Y13DRAFT_185917 [Hypoxylon sp. FL1857]